ncbi:MAG TPA: iron ABC transporter permease [Treponema sp.]|nr:iron ABC transporter permease [Treponema sp.]
MFVLLAFVLAASVCSGSVRISLAELFRAFASRVSGGEGGTAGTIVFELRLPRSLLAAAVGAALAASGAGFQGVFRNPLADPYVIGASSGAALGAALAITFGAADLGPISSTSLFAFGGALAATGLAFALSRTVADPPPASALLLAGTALSALFSALLSLVLVIKDKDLHTVYYWLLGGFGVSTWNDLVSTVPVMALGIAIVMLASRPLDLLAFGEESASSLGLDVRKARAAAVVGASLAAAAAVGAAGIVGFVGLVAPHAARLVVGPGHRRLVPTAALVGAVLVLLADLFARTVASPLELPIGVVTALVGAPFFLYLLAKRGAGSGAGSAGGRGGGR